MKKKRPLNRKSFVIASLRRSSLRWPPRNEAYSNARVSRGFYKCAMCLNDFHRKQIRLDHVLSVVDVKTGFTTFDNYIERLLPLEPNSFQCLCLTCHDIKSTIENSLRKSVKKRVKKRIVDKKSKRK